MVGVKCNRSLAAPGDALANARITTVLASLEGGRARTLLSAFTNLTTRRRRTGLIPSSPPDDRGRDDDTGGGGGAKKGVLNAF